MQKLLIEGIQVSEDWLNKPDALKSLDTHEVSLAEKYVVIYCTAEGPITGQLPQIMSEIHLSASHGVNMIVLAIDGSPERDIYAGRSHEGPALTDSGMSSLCSLIDQICNDFPDTGMAISFHPHAGTYIESPNETRALFQELNTHRMGLCLDTGHWIVGGGDACEALHEFRSLITHIHLKDVDAGALSRLVSGETPNLEDSVETEFLFTSLGAGTLDLEQFLAILHETKFAGWLMLEQDATPFSAYGSTLLSRAVLDFIAPSGWLAEGGSI
jgi:inosose dehydratase